MKKDLKIDSNSQIVYSWNSGESGQLTVEYSGLQNSFYVDENGNKINISKIVATYIPDASDTKHGLIIFSDPTDGFGYLNTTGANVNYKFYNQANQQIDFKNNTAWLAVTSLNSTITNTETAKIINGGKAYGLAGSSIKAHDDGSLYADNHNDGPDGTWDFQAHDGQSWDNKGINEYYGAGLISLQNSDSTVRYALLKNQTKESGNGPWVTPTTIIPETPTPRSQIHYHYNKTLILSVEILFRCNMCKDIDLKTSYFRITDIFTFQVNCSKLQTFYKIKLANIRPKVSFNTFKVLYFDFLLRNEITRNTINRKLIINII